ncbi:MAG: epoxyqueuosine reductase QueH [Desulfobulbaceae bacterium]|nr:epoxyqueuosine reductase QueH [Desulfobulbaceae bacterium]
MKILLHVCCAPCSIYPVAELRAKGIEVVGFFHNPNIHPYKEFKRRLETVEDFAGLEKLQVEIDRDYGLREFLRKTVFHEQERCAFCYEMRLAATAERAAALRADAFSTTLLYSKYQNHTLIRKQAEAFAEQFGVPFYYEDFRQGWQEGIDASIAMGLYRQPYCGCIYSEQERFDNRWKKRQKKAKG